MGVTWQKKI